MEKFIVTGASRGLGKAVARHLLQTERAVILSGRASKNFERAIADLQQEGLTPEALIMDVTSQESVDQSVSQVSERHGSIDCLINNAGIMIKSEELFEEFSVQAFHTTIDTNTLGLLRVSLAFAPLLFNSPNPRIINISSGLGVIKDMGSNYPSYRLSKTAVNAITAQSHHAWYKKHGIRTLAVCPGWVKTDMGGENAALDLDQGIKSILWAIETSPDGPSGGLFRNGRPLPW